MVYKINGNKLWDYGIRVLQSGGWFDMPARMGETERDWHESNGVEPFVDKEEIYYKHRRINIECLMEADSIVDLQYQLGMFKDLVYSGILTLENDYGSYQVILKEGAKIEFSNTLHKSISAKFTLKFSQIDWSPGKSNLSPEWNKDYSESHYYIDGISLFDLGIVMEENPKGAFDFTKMKGVNLNEFFPGESEAITARGARDITLKCAMTADSVTDLQDRLSYLYNLLSNEGLRKLKLKGIEGEYKVFSRDGVKINQIYKSDEVVVRFDLVLHEPYPKVENVSINYLLNYTGTHKIQTESGEDIIIIGSRDKIQMSKVYLYTDSEDKDATYLWLDTERDSSHTDYNVEADPVYLPLEEL